MESFIISFHSISFHQFKHTLTIKLSEKADDMDDVGGGGKINELISYKYSTKKNYYEHLNIKNFQLL